MEYRLAAEGRVDELRGWLRAHPERVNVPNSTSQMTLLYTAISNSGRSDVASLQAGVMHYLSTVRMLCEEYGADVAAPNGGSYNTAVHLAAQLGAGSILRYLVVDLNAPVDIRNIFNETPLQLAERYQHISCVQILKNASTRTMDDTATSTAARSSVGGNDISGGDKLSLNSQQHTRRFEHLRLSDSDDEEQFAAPQAAVENHQTFEPLDLTSATPSSSLVNGTVKPCQLWGVTAASAATPTSLATVLKSEMGKGESGVGNVLPRTRVISQSTRSTPRNTNISQVSPQLSTSNHDGSGAVLGTIGPIQHHIEAAEYAAPPEDILPSSRRHFDPVGGTTTTNPPPPDTDAVMSATASPLLSTQLQLRQPVLPRQEYDISTSRVFSNPDLQGFRSAFGDGFVYLQCRDHYEIRGVLPYRYKGVVYHTPIIISLYAPAPHTSQTNSDRIDGGSTSTASLPCNSESTTHGEATRMMYCRYRVALDLQRLNGYAISKKAFYIDPISGAVIPCPGDGLYQTLAGYMMNVVVANFERVPPLVMASCSYAFPSTAIISQLGSDTGKDIFRYHQSHTSPSYMQNALVKRSSAHLRCYRIWQELSRFGDGLSRYFANHHRIVSYVPIYSEHKEAVLTTSQQRFYPTTLDSSRAPGSTASPLSPTEAASPGRAVLQQVSNRIIVQVYIRVQLQFTLPPSPPQSSMANTNSSIAYNRPPRVYLIDAAVNPERLRMSDGGDGTSLTTASWTAQVFAPLLCDATTAEVKEEVLQPALDEWAATGSLYNILRTLQNVLRDTLEKFAMKYQQQFPTATTAAAAMTTAARTSAGDVSTGAARQSEFSSAGSALDTFFTSPPNIKTISASGSSSHNDLCIAVPGGSASGGGAALAQSSTSGVCLLCSQLLQLRALLQPCGHDTLCLSCIERYQSHCRGEMFPCPVCAVPVQHVFEVYL